MIPNLNIVIEGIREATSKLKALRSRVKDWTPIEDNLHQILIDRQVSNFATAGRSEGRPWPSYSAEPKYRAYKRAITGHEELLRWDKNGTYERLYPSLTDPRDENHIWNQGRVPTSFQFGTSLSYASELERGTTGPFGEPSPPREFSHVGRNTTRLVAESIGRWIFKG